MTRQIVAIAILTATICGGVGATAAASRICPLFIVNACDDQLTPADKCVDFYASLLRAGVKAELHVFSKGAHGFGLGDGRGKSTALWPASFAAWLQDSDMIQDK